uniref:treslin n=1 Tax=Panthera onca TaxID=9690 RepID=UPI00295358C8|nr:treslin [Panthera onca]
MACCHNVMLLLDTAGGAAGRSPARRAALRLLTYLSCRFGLARVRWAFKFFDSQGARSRPSRVSDFRELGARSWEDFEEELDAVLGDGAHGAHLPGPAPRASHTHGALMETLLDYQWDRPEITSPTKPILRSSGRRLLDVESEAKEAETALGGFVNAVFLLAPCPHSQRELLQFVSGCEAQAQRLPPAPKQVMEKLLPKRVQEVMIARKITLYWVDTTEWPKLWESPDHLGYWTVCQLLHLVGGTILPSETFRQDCTKAGKILLGSEKKLSSESPLTSWISTLPSDATLNCLLYNSPAYEASFPRMEGMLFLPVEDKEIQETWTVTLEPLAMHQRHFQKPVRIFLKGTAARWSLPASSILGTDSWLLQSPEESESTQRLLFQQLVSRLTAQDLHLVASVDPGEGWPPITGVISPLSTNATILTVFRTEEAEFQRHFLQTVVAESPQDTASLFSDVMDIVLSQIHSSLEDPATCAPPVPEWAQQELGRTGPWSAAVMEKWFPCSNLTGASSSLMESFCSVSQPKSRSVQRVHSFQQDKSDQREKSPNRSIRSPKSLLFGALHEMVSPSEKGSARLQRTSRSTLGSEIPTAYQTPKKSNRKSPSSSKATPRRFPRMPRTPLRTPERWQKPPTEVTPAKKAIFEESLKDSSQDWGSPSQPKVTPQKGCSLAKGGTSPLEKKIPRTPRRPGGQPAGFLRNSTWPLSVTSSPESTPCPAAPNGTAGLSPAGSSPRAAASGVRGETPPDQEHHRPCVPGASQAGELAEKGEEKAASTPGSPGMTSLVPPPSPPPEKPFTFPSGKASKKSPFQKFSTNSPSPGEMDWREPWKAPNVASPLSCPAPSTPPRILQNAQSDPAPALPPSKTGKRCREPSDLASSFLEHQPSASAAPREAPADNPAASTDARKDQKEASLSLRSSPERHSYPGLGFRRDWRLSSPLLMASDTEYLTLLDKAQLDGSDGLQSDVAPMGEERQSRTMVAKKSSPSSPGVLPSPRSCGPGSPPTPSYDLRCTADRRQRQAAAQLEDLQASAQLPEAPASPQTYEVELEMRASGLPKLRIRKIDPGCVCEAESLRRAGSSRGDESSLPGVGLPRAGRSSGRPEATYVSPPCLRPSHSTPGKSGGQMYICQSCTPTRGPSSTPSPFQTDGSVPWTPSPKHSGKTTPDTIRDWPRRKRAVGSSSAARSEVSADLPAGVSLLEPERRERGPELSISRTPLLGDFELEGVCQLPDHSPPGDSVPKAEEACSWGQFGLGSRKRLLPAEEEMECQAKRACDGQRGDPELSKSEERSPGASVLYLPSTGDDEVFFSGSTPSPGCAVRSGVSASGLQALTQSPLLFQGRTPSSRWNDARDEDMDVFPATAEDSPFSRALSRRRPIGRTYTRKKLIS